MHVRIQGAREHNLKDIDVEFGDGLTVVTGVSGSGKTSLVFDTLYHEARRRFLDVFSLGSAGLQLSPARVEAITGLGPAVAVGQDLLNRNPNSTLATASGLHPFLRLLYARFGERHCARCGAGLLLHTADEIIERLLKAAQQHPVQVDVPLLRRAPGSHQTLLGLLADTFSPEALRVDGHPWRPQELDPAAPHDIDVNVATLDRAAAARDARAAVETASALGGYAVTVRGSQAGPDTGLMLSFAAVCAACGAWFGDLEPKHFHSGCPHCQGAGCEVCSGTGLHPEASNVSWHGLRLTALLAHSVEEVRTLFAQSELPSTAARLQEEIARRLEALEAIGLGYIALERPSPTLSRGEAQRVRLAVALTSRLEDMLHVLDEPTIGQHPVDVARLLPAFRKLAGPVVYVEHDRAAAAVADHAIDLGPGAGEAGGRLLFSGAPADLWQTDTPTGRFFSLQERVHRPVPRPTPQRFLTVQGAHLRNLQQVDVSIPLSRFTVVTGVSGSGKSTLVQDVLVASLVDRTPTGCQALHGPALKPVLVDQSPIGRNPRSNPATYTKLSDVIRDLFATVTSLSPSHFSFNRPEGACPACNGMGAIEVKMRYLPSTWVHCAACDGQRFSDEVLSARIALGDRRLCVADLYELSVLETIPLLVDDARLSAKNQRTARHILEALRDVGLGYLPLGQPSPTLSGGEAQRVKLAKHLGRRALATQLLVLDEPSTGLHPQDIAGLLIVLDRLVRASGTVVVVEHNLDIIRAADWVIDLGPGSGPAGGRVLYAGPPSGLPQAAESATGQAMQAEASLQPRSRGATSPPDRARHIAIRNARAHNLQGIDVDLPKGALTVVTGVSGSGKSSLVGDVLEAEARRRFLETLSLYERQSVQEGPEAPVGSVTGLGVTLTVGAERGRYDVRATVGATTEISHHLAVLLAWIGQRRCLACDGAMQRVAQTNDDGRAQGWAAWQCPVCNASAPVAAPRHFSPTTYAAACLTCHGVGTLQVPRPEKLIIHPDKPLCAGAMYSPGFFPKGYLCKPFNHGYNMVQALADRYDFDPSTTPWDQMTPAAQQAFLFGDPEPLQVTFRSRTRTHVGTATFPGFYGFVRDWDIGGTYTESEPCPDCNGARLRPEYLAVQLAGHNMHDLSEMPLDRLARTLDDLSIRESAAVVAAASLHTVRTRTRFLRQVGLGYLHLNRVSATLSAGEAQRIKLAGLLGSGLTSLTILLDEPTRGLHPAEVQALLGALSELRDKGNTLIVVEHDPVLIRAADHLVDMGPGAGAAGGRIVAQGAPARLAQANTLTARWLRGERQPALHRPRRAPRGWLAIRGARAHNLQGQEVRMPLGALVGVCGVSGSGKSTLLIDTLGRALAPQKQTTSVAYEPVAPGAHQAIEGAPARAILVDQARAGVVSPAAFLDLNRPLRRVYAASADAVALGLDESQLSQGCSACNGHGVIKTDMGFLPDVYTPCETCRGTGHIPEAWDVHARDIPFPELFALTIDQVHETFGDIDAVASPLVAAIEVGLGYLVLRQPAYTLSGGEAQRLKIAKELARRNNRATPTLYILDEPTVGQHLEDVARLVGVLHRLVDAGHTVIAIEHHPHLLAACDWLLELGPGGGPDGGRIIATGTPETLASGESPTAPYLKEVLQR